jgi:hypothetical protein
MQIYEVKDENGNVVHGFATASFPLPADHWVYQEPVEPQAIGGLSREMLHELRGKVREALKYTIQACTSQGKDEDFDPDAMLLTMENVLFVRQEKINEI